MLLLDVGRASTEPVYKYTGMDPGIYQRGNYRWLLAATTSSGQAKGVLARLVVADENLDYRPVMLAEAATWLRQMGKTAVQMAVPEGREQLAAQLECVGWVKCQSWPRLVKWLK